MTTRNNKFTGAMISLMLVLLLSLNAFGINAAGTFTSVSSTAASGFVVIKSDPSGAQVFINGKDTGKKTPFQLQLEAGNYTFSLQLAEYREYKGSFTITDGQTTTSEARLVAAYGSIDITSEPSGAMIFLDGKTTGKSTPNKIDKVASGIHTISLSRDMYSDASQRIEVSDERISKVFLELAAGYGTIGIVAKPEASIYIDGNALATSSYAGRLSPGMHLVEIRKDKYYSQRKEIKISSGEEMKLSFELKPILGNLSVMCDPIETEIFIDGKSYGLSPQIISNLIVGDYSLELKKPGYVQVTRRITINENSTISVNESLSSGINIRISSRPTGANLTINETVSGYTPKDLFTAPGTFNFSLKKEFYNDFDRTLTIRRDTSLNFILINKVGKIQLSSFPSGSSCMIDGVSKGQTPLLVEIPQGNHNISIIKSGYYTYEKDILLKDEGFFINQTLQKQNPNRGSAFLINLVCPGAGNTYLTGKKSYLWISAAFYGLLIPGLVNYDNDNAIIAMPAIMYYIFINPMISFLPDRSSFRNLPRKY